MQPDIAAFLHVHLAHVGAETPHHQHLLDGRAVGHRGIGSVFQGNNTAPAVTAIRRHTDFGLAVDDAAGERFGAEATEHDHMWRADSRAGQHADHQFRNHRHIEGYSITFLHAQIEQYRRKAIDLAIQVLIGEHARVTRLTFPDEGCFIATSSLAMAIDAIVGSVKLTPHKPFRPGRIPFEHAVPPLEPIQSIRSTGPKSLWVVMCHLINRGITNICLCRKGSRGWKRSCFLQQRVNGRNRPRRILRTGHACPFHDGQMNATTPWNPVDANRTYAP